MVSVEQVSSLFFSMGYVHTLFGFLSLTFAWTALSAVEPSSRPLTVNSSLGAPSCTPESNGPNDLILTEIFRRAKIPAQVVFTPPERSLFNVNAGIDDADGFRSRSLSESFANLVYVPEVVFSAEYRAYYRKSFTSQLTVLEDLIPFSVGILRGRPALVKRLAQLKQLSQMSSQESLFQMLEAGRIEIVVTDTFAASTVIKTLGFSDIVESQLMGVAPQYLYLNKKHADLLPQLSKAIREMREEGFAERVFAESTRKFDHADHP